MDDFSGAYGRTSRTFGADLFHPDQFRQSYFFQDTWKITPALALTLGLRYENFGQPANALPYPAFSGFDPARFLKPNKLNRDDNNFGPAFGFAWSPSRQSGWLGELLGEHKTVWRGGYQISYDGFFTQMIALGLATSTPNAITTVANAPNTGRGSPNWFAQLPAIAATSSPLDAQNGVIEKNFRSPYTGRWSFGFERQLPGKLLLDISYVGSKSHKLSAWADLNPRLLDGQYLHPGFGQRWVRTSQANSTYHAMQSRLDRRFAQGCHLAASYTWSRNIDNAAEGGAHVNSQSSPNNMPSMPVAQGGLKLDRGPSDYDRTHRLTVAYMWEIRRPRTGRWSYALGGWSVAGISSFQSGTPLTPLNGSDRNNDTITVNDRPDIGNPNAPLNSRAVIAAASGPQWKTVRHRRAALLELGVGPQLAANMAGSGHGPWYLALTKALNVGLSKAYFRSLGLPSYSRTVSVTVSNRRIRTRTYGGVAGVGGRPPPLCRSNAPSRSGINLPPPWMIVATSCVAACSSARRSHAAERRAR